MRLTLAFLTAAVFAMPLAPARAEVDCEAARCTAAQRISNCPCDSENHGRYVSCVARAVRDLAHNDEIPRNCKGKIIRCAARSTCGKEGFSTCTPTCNIVPPATSGTCVNDPTVTCTSNSDCGRCHTRREGTCPPGTTESKGSCCPAPNCPL